MSIRGRIFIIVMSCLSLGLLFAFIVAERDLGASLQDQIQVELQKQGQIIQSSLGSLSQYNDLNSLKDETDNLAEASQSRITLINSSGVVISDSNIDVDDLDKIDNHSNRPEVIDAQNNGMGWSRRFSDTIQQEMLYFAIVDPSSTQQGVIRLAVPYNYFDQAFRSLNTPIILILVVALIASILAGIIAGNYTRENFLELEHAVSRLESGDLKKKTIKSLPTKRVDEIGSVARSLSSISADLKNQMTLLAKQRNQFGSVLNDLGQGIIVFNEEGTVTFNNDESLNILEIEDLINLNIKDFELKPIKLMFDQAKKKGKYAMEFEIESNMVNKWILAQMNRAKGTKEFILVLHDETQLRDMDSMRRDFVANLSHELRTPVSVIRANSETLLDGALDNSKDARRFTSAILHNSERLTEMVTNLIDLSRIEYGDNQFNLEEIDLKNKVNSVVEAMSNLAAKKKINLKFDYVGDAMVKADHSALEQVLNNLLENSIKYSNTNSEVEIKIRKRDNFYKVSILDTGSGIKEHESTLVFNRFYRTAKARAESKDGSGLGLAIVKHLVNQLGGEVGVMPRKNRGSRFWFTVQSI